MAISQNVSSTGAAFPGLEAREALAESPPACPACSAPASDGSIERYGKYALFHCPACDLQFWEPRIMPDAHWYEQMYGGRDEKLMPLEPGHKFFLADPLAPGRGELLDIGCGTGNFLAAARAAGYGVTGTELDRNAARFAKEKLGLQRVLGQTISEFAEQNPNEKFDIVTFFEVLEHQAAPTVFLGKVKACLRSGGYIALSVPNRERWLTGPDVLDYPPNHFLRWNADALRNFLGTKGFEVLSVKEEPAGIKYSARMINIRMRTGLSQKVAGDLRANFKDVMQMSPREADAALNAAPTARRRAVELLGWIKYAACCPLAVAAYPYVQMRGRKGAYLYLLAQFKE